GFQGPNGGGSYTHNRWDASLFYYGPSGSWARGIDAGAVVHYVGQYWDNVKFDFFDARTRPGFAPDAFGLCTALSAALFEPSQFPGGVVPGKKDPGFVPCVGSVDRKVREWVTVD